MSTTQKGTLSNGRVISYAMGDVANNLAFQMTSMFLMVYMTDIVGLSAAAAGTIYAVTKVWAGVADLVAGSTVDKANTKWGRLRPWILWGSTPLAIALVLLFSTPAGLTPTQAFVWVLLLDAAFQLAYSFVNIPYGSLSAAMTQNSLDRSRLSGARSIASAVTGVALSAVISPQFQGIQDLPMEEVRFKFTITCIILGALAVALYLVCFLNTREVVPRGPGKSKMSTTLKMVGKNRPLLTLCVGAFFLLGAMFTMNAVAMYYVRSVLGNASFFTFLMLAQTVGTILAASFVPTITVRLGKRIGYVIFAGIAVLGYVIVALVPAGGLVMAIVAWFIFGIGSGGTNALMFSMQADTVDYGEWKTGTRSEGGAYSILSFVRKCGQGLGGALGGPIIAAFGYSAAIKAGDAGFDHMVTGLRIATGWVPAALGVIAGLIIFFYPLTEKAHAKLVGELNERRATAAGVPADTVDEGVPAPAGPVVTLFEQYGAGADAIGRKVAERLGVPYVGQRLSSTDIEAVEPAGLELESGWDRFVRSLANRGVSDADLNLGSDQAADRHLAAQNTVEVLDAVASGGVILGRNATVILGQHPGALHVRLNAPAYVRVGRAAELDGITAEVAEERREQEDLIRAELSQRLYGWNPNDDEHYDVVVNTGRYSLDEAADMIIRAYETRFGTRR
ncbi:MAG: MFS transporter [Propioniciclava sp.]|nr:MFS transporter [Propioniciclava sp.]